MKRKGRKLAKTPGDYWNPISIDQTKYICRPNLRNLSKKYIDQIEEMYELTRRNMSTQIYLVCIFYELLFMLINLNMKLIDKN